MRVRGTQSLVQMLGACARRPGLLALEVGWRWAFGIPALALCFYEGLRLFHNPVVQSLFTPEKLAGYSPTDPMASAQQAVAAASQLVPLLLHLVFRLVPLLAAGWAIVSGLGRSFVLRRLDPAMRFMPFTLIALQIIRVVALGATVFGWVEGIRWAADSTLTPARPGAEPNLVGYFAWVICISLGSVTLWALISWIVSIAPLIAMLDGIGLCASLLRSLRLGPLTAKLAEVNLSLLIVKLALVVLAIVFSAMPLPFAASGTPLYLWWVAVTVLYLVVSDFFQLARLAVFVELWRVFRAGS